jgi:hypothetical protein
MLPTLVRRALRGRVLILWLAILLASSMAAAGPPPRPNPNIEFQVEGTVQAMARMADGRTVIGGSFTRVDGQPRQNLARLAADGSVDTSFVGDADDAVNALLALGDGRVVVGGDFLHVEGQPYAGLAVLDGNGDLDPSFQANHAIFDGPVYALATSADGQSIYAGGLFNGSGYTRVAKFALATGQPDPNFRIAFGSGSIRVMVADGTGGLFIGGTFQDAGGNAALDRLARVVDNGNAAATVDTVFLPTINNNVFALALDATSLYVGGTFTSAGNPATPRSRLARFARVDGVLDPVWNPGANGMVQSMRLAGGDLYVGGRFQSVSGQPRPRVARIAAVTGVLQSWTAPAITGGTGVMALEASVDTLLVAGSFTAVGAAERFGLAGFALTDVSLQAQPDAQATAGGGPSTVLVHPDGSLWVGGHFIMANGQPHRGLVRLAPDGSLDAGVAPQIDGWVFDLAVDPLQRVYAVGSFSTVDGQPHASIARFASDGTLDAAFTAGVGALTSIYDVETSGSALYVAGNFTSVGISGGSQDPAAYVAKLDTGTGLFDPAWTPAIPPPANKVPVQALAVDPAGGALFIGGGFTSVDGLPRLGVAKLSIVTGEVDPAFVANVDQAAAGQSGDVWALAFGGGQLYIGGYQFSSINGIGPLVALARVSGTSGTPDAGWDAGLFAGADPYVETLAFESPTRLLAAGWFVTPAGGAFARYRLDSTEVVDTAFAPQVGPPSGEFGYQIAYRPDDQAAVVTGGFTTAGAETRTGLAAFKTENLVFADGFED